jgi:hypothetical protein
LGMTVVLSAVGLFLCAFTSSPCNVEMSAQKPLNRCLSTWVVTSRDAQLSAVQKQIFSGTKMTVDAVDSESPPEAIGP